MTALIESSLFGDGKPLVFGVFLNTVRFATQWTAMDRADGDGFHFTLYLELDPAAVGSGGSVIRQRASLTCDRDLNPLSYQSEANGVRIALELAGDVVHATLADGTTRDVPRGGAQLLVEAYMFGLDAIGLAHAATQGLLTDKARLVAFVTNSLIALPVELSVAPDLGTHDGGRWFRSTQGEELLIRGDGALLVSRMTAQGVEARREDQGPPLPGWRDEVLAARAAVYEPDQGSSIHLEEVDIPADGSVLGGTLSCPKTEGPFPAVLFIAGSGAPDRNGISGELDAGTHEIMDQLAAAGVLGLRFDSRGAGRTPIGTEGLEPSLQGRTEDAKAALEFLRRRPECDRDRVFLAGHSQGGIVAMQIAARDEALRGVALLATPARPIDEVMLDQSEHHADRLALSPDVRAARRQQMREFAALVREGATFEEGKVADLMLSGTPYLRWMKEHLDNPGAELIRRLRCPVLICQGDKDTRVSVERDAQALSSAARSANVSARLVILEGDDHHFKLVHEGESTPALDFDRSRHVDARLIDVLAQWFVE
jgi:uncharacterized protein